MNFPTFSLKRKVSPPLPGSAVQQRRERVGRIARTAAWIGVPLLLFAAYVWFLFLPAAHTRGLITKQVTVGYLVAAACRMYADDNEGRFPPDVRALEQYYLRLDSESFMRVPGYREKGGGLVYLPGLRSDSPPHLPLVVGPLERRSNRHAVVCVDASKHEVTEEEFARIVKEYLSWLEKNAPRIARNSVDSES